MNSGTVFMMMVLLATVFVIYSTGAPPQKEMMMSEISKIFDEADIKGEADEILASAKELVGIKVKRAAETNNNNHHVHSAACRGGGMNRGGGGPPPPPPSNATS